jgi:Nucleoside-diphosphate-sugar epimerases
MKILITGASGFLGSRLAAALLAGAPDVPAVSTLVAVDTAVGGIDDPRVQWRTGTIADERFTQSVVEDGVDLVYHLAAVVSGQAEAEFDLGMRVNVDATRALLDACRRLGKPPRFVFSSTLAVSAARCLRWCRKMPPWSRNRRTAPRRPLPNSSSTSIRESDSWTALSAACRQWRSVPVRPTPPHRRS